MTFDARMQVADAIATIRMSGELDARSAQRFNDLITEAAKHDIGKLVLLADELSYMSSAGIRCLVFAYQKMPAGVQIVLSGAQPDVAETIRLTGFDRTLVLVEGGAPQ
jgi:anti-anti-sigma factor